MGASYDTLCAHFAHQAYGLRSIYKRLQGDSTHTKWTPALFID